MKILGVDTSCDESCAAIFDTDRWSILSNVVHSHVDVMKKYGGVVPEIASREHLRGLPLAVVETLESADLTPGDIDFFAVTHRPGLIGALLVGVSFTKALAFSLGKPFTVVNHVEAHLMSPFVISAQGVNPPKFPWIGLVVSGGHTELFLVRGPADFSWLGGTLDDAAGEAFDKIGKLLGLPYPAGPFIDEWVREKGTAADRKRFAFPRAATQPLHFSYSGLKTAVANQVTALGAATERDKLALVASAQEAILDPLVEQVRKAQNIHGVSSIVVTGGVACNSRLREKLPDAFFPPPKFCADNAAMVALLAALLEREGKLRASPLTATAYPTFD